MAYNTPPTKATGDTLTAAEWNTYVRDNMAAGVPDVMGAAGDLLVGSGPDAANVLSKGDDGAVLRMIGGNVSWGVPLITRFGGHATNWATSGSSIYTPDQYRMEMGVFNFASIGATTNIYGGFNFNAAFAGTPLVFLTTFKPTADVRSLIYALTASHLDIALYNYTALTITNVAVMWMAIGPTA